MKFRNGFVTNSSSSSFVIATKRDENGEPTEELKQKLLKWAINTLNLNSPIKNKKELKAWFVEHECYSYSYNYSLEKILSFESLKKEYNENLNKILNGEIVSYSYLKIDTQEKLDSYFRAHKYAAQPIIDEICHQDEDVKQEYLKYQNLLKNEETRYITIYGEKVSSIEELNKIFAFRFYWVDYFFEKEVETDDALLDKFNRLLNTINNGYQISTGTVSCESSDEAIYLFEEAFNTLEDSNDFVGIDTRLEY